MQGINVNLGVVTLNLVDIALSSWKDFDKFWDIFEYRTELCHKAHKQRLKYLKNTRAAEAPILWVDGALARLNPEDKIEPLFYKGYATVSLGYAGLYECVKYMTGHSHMEEGIGHDFGIEIMKRLNEKTAQWKAAEDID